MKNLHKLFLVFILAAASSCTYEFPIAETPTSGSADFTKVVAIGNSLTAGYLNGALYDAGQMASYANLVAEQIILDNNGSFNQPDINAVDGDFGFSGGAFGRLQLKNPANPAPAPIVPGQAITPYGGDKSALNNFGVPGMRIVDVAFPGYGNLNPYYGRFAPDPTTSTVLGDAIAANGSFILFWLGNNDALGYATRGATGSEDGDGTDPGDMTNITLFDGAFRAAVSALITNEGKQGILANIPNVQDIAHFTTVPWNAIPFDTSDPVDDATVEALNAGYAVYNGGLDQMVGLSIITQAEADRRYIMFANGNNGIVIFDDKSLTDLTGFDPGLINMRQASADDLITLTAGAVLGTLADPADPTSAIGVGVPLDERYTLILADQEALAQRIADFNAIIESVVDGSGGNLALLDMNTIFADFAQNGVIIRGSVMNATIIPPAGGFSLDGVHPNQRGAAYLASLFIDRINEVFGANITNINPNDYPGNELPIP